MANKLTYKVKYPNGDVETFHSLKAYKANDATSYLERNPFSNLEVYRGKKLYGVFYSINGKIIMVRS